MSSLALFAIYQIVRDHTDNEHGLTQEEIIDALDREYGISLERKAVGRHLDDIVSNMISKRVEIKKDRRNGAFVTKREFTTDQLRLLVDCVQSCASISDAEAKDIVDRLCELGGDYFNKSIARVKVKGGAKRSENSEQFKSNQKIAQAINEQKKIQFGRVKYGPNKTLIEDSKYKYLVSPYQLFIHNNMYYLFCYDELHEHLALHRLDHLKNVKIVDEQRTPLSAISSYDDSTGIRDIVKKNPYMFIDTPVDVTFLTDEETIDNIIITFGKDSVWIHPTDSSTDNPKYTVTIQGVSFLAMKYWALQYIDHIEVTEPAELREEIAKSLKAGVEKYR